MEETHIDSSSLINRLKRKTVISSSGCWEWVGSLRKDGYGQIHIGSRPNRVNTRVHCLGYSLLISPVPDGLCVLHKCDNRRCWNPGHLWLGTRKQNQADMKQKGRAARGSRNASAKLSRSDISEILRLRSIGLKQVDVAARFGVQQSLISMIETGKIWAHSDG